MVWTNPPTPWWQCQACEVMWKANDRKRCWNCRSRKAERQHRVPMSTSSYAWFTPNEGAPPGLALPKTE